MPSHTDEYQTTLKRMDALRERRAVLAAKAEEIASKRLALSESLAAEGVNVEDLPAEKKRFEKALVELRAQATQLMDDFEERLDRAERGDAPETATTEPSDPGGMEIE